VKGKLATLIGVLVLLVGVHLLFLRSAPLETPLTGELFISNVTGYIAGYPNETVELHLYWIQAGNGSFNGAFRLTNLPSCVKAGNVGLTELHETGSLKKAIIHVGLTLGKPGRCVVDGVYLELSRENGSKRIPLGRIEVVILKPEAEELLITGYIGGSSGSEPPREVLFSYAILNPLSEPVEVLNVTFNLSDFRLEGFRPLKILPNQMANVTFKLVNTTELRSLYVIRPILVYTVGSEIHMMPAETYHLDTVPDDETLKKMLEGLKAPSSSSRPPTPAPRLP